MITSQDRIKYQYFTDDSILGIKLIGGMTNKVLLAYKKGDKRIESAIKILMGKKTNPNWIRGRIAEELFDRKMIDIDEFDKMSA